MKIGIQNIHQSPNIFYLGIHKYIIELLIEKQVHCLYFDPISLIGDRNVVKNILNLYNTISQLNEISIPWDQIEIITTTRELNKKCDILLNFNSHLGESQFPKHLKNFNGIKIFHVNDYFWNRPASVLNKYFEDNGIDFLMGYARHDVHCEYFKKSFPKYIGKVISVPFGFSDRFVEYKSFDQRISKCLAVGSVNPLRPLQSSKENFIESASFYPDEAWFHKFRRMLVLKKNHLAYIVDSMLPEFPDYKDFKYDLVEKFNSYKMFVSDESIFKFPPAKYFEGPASGAVLVCSDHQCNKDLGFIDGENCIMHQEFDLIDFEEKIRFYIKNDDELNKIQKQGTRFVREKYNHKSIANSLISEITDLYNF
jgi:hypothetical protein